MAEVPAFPVRVDRAHKVQVLRHRLPPFLSEAFGGSTGLIEIDVAHVLLDHAVGPNRDDPVTKSDLPAAANRTARHDDHGKTDSVAKIDDFVDLDVKILVRAQHVFKQAPDRRCPLEPAGLPAQDSARRVKALYRIEVTPVQSFKEAARKLYQVGGRGLLGHRQSSIPRQLRTRFQGARQITSAGTP